MLTRREKPYTEGTLEGLFGGYCPDEEKQLQQEIIRILAGGDNIEFRIPAADTGAEIFFNNREMLARFASMSKPSQLMFLRAVLRCMEDTKVDEVRLTIHWSAKSQRIIRIMQINSDGCLNIYI